jgi:glycosyltransferase involved in cell wall biosynthesis
MMPQAAAPDRPLRVAYLVNQYPTTSHTFIRREIAGVEACGVEVLRYSIREHPGDLVHPEDLRERERTKILLHRSLAGGFLRVALTRPARLLGTLAAAWRMGGRSPSGRLRHLAYVAEACVLLGEFRRWPVDHLHAHFGTNPAAVALLCRLLGGPPYSFTAHGSELFTSPESHSVGEKVSGAAFAVAVCEFGRSQMERATEPVHRDRIRIVHCGVDRAFLEAPAVPVPDRPRLVVVGRLSEEKGQRILVAAAARLKGEGRAFEVVLVGDGPLRGALEEQIRSLGLGQMVRLTGSLDGEGVRREILGAQGLVVPSLGEGLPVVLMEAFALGRPAIATSVAGIPELVLPGVSGWLVPAGSEEALAGAMRELFQTAPARLAEMGQAGRRLVEERHDAAREASRLVRLFRGEKG